MKRATIAVVPVNSPDINEVITITARPEMPTPAIEAAPSLPTQIMSTVGPSVEREELTVMGQDRDQRLPIRLPCVQSRLGLVMPLGTFEVTTDKID
jgi:hypothetical protein